MTWSKVIKFDRVLRQFSWGLILFGECNSGERSKEMYVHIGEKENGKMFRYVKVKHVTN